LAAIFKSSILWAAFLVIAGAGLTGARAEDRARDAICALLATGRPVLEPFISDRFRGSTSDPAIDCMMWQSFIYLNWPVDRRNPGKPDAKARFGGPGPTVWESFKRYDQVFRPHAMPPRPWGAESPLPRHLETAHQADGKVLIDQAGQPVYYEMALDEDEFNYITHYRLYDADAQLAFAAKYGIELPHSLDEHYGRLGAIEVKAAWKILTRQELEAHPSRFHTAPAILKDGSKVVVGLVGLHLYQRFADFRQGVWASFAQIDNVPSQREENSGPYSFFDPGCHECRVNTEVKAPTPTQVAEMFPVVSVVAAINDYMRDTIRDADPQSPWQFYRMIGAQWPKTSMMIGTPGQLAPLPEGNPSTSTLTNPVIETFEQGAEVSCIGCHTKAATAKTSAAGPLATNYSFLFAHAQSANHQP